MDQSSEAMNTTSDRDKEELSPKSKKEEEEQIDSFLRRKFPGMTENETSEKRSYLKACLAKDRSKKQ